MFIPSSSERSLHWKTPSQRSLGGRQEPSPHRHPPFRHPKGQFLVPDWGMEVPLASGYRIGPPAYVTRAVATTTRRKSHFHLPSQGLRIRLQQPTGHKVLIYVEYKTVSGVFQNIDPPPPLPPASMSSPRTKGGGNTLAGRWGGRGSIFWKTPDIGLATYSIIPLRHRH